MNSTLLTPAFWENIALPIATLVFVTLVIIVPIMHQLLTSYPKKWKEVKDASTKEHQDIIKAVEKQTENSNRNKEAIQSILVSIGVVEENMRALHHDFTELQSKFQLAKEQNLLVSSRINSTDDIRADELKQLRTILSELTREIAKIGMLRESLAEHSFMAGKINE